MTLASYEVLSTRRSCRGRMALLGVTILLCAQPLAALLGPKAEESGLELVFRYDPELPRRFFGDPGRIRQILLNLVGNAIKFTSEGHVLIDVDGMPGDEEAELRISVVDTCIGLAPEAIDRMFESFSQADASVTREYGGTGLGLSISKQLAALMGGTLTAESAEGEGSTFHVDIVLPRSPEPTTLLSDPGVLSGLHVLIVDDNEVNRAVLLEQLASWGVRCVAVEGGPEALVALRAGQASGDPFDLSVLDYNMPGMDGASLARAILAEPDLEFPRLVLLTSSGQRGDGKSASEAGFHGYLVKPTAPDVLRDLLIEVMAEDDEAEGERDLVTRHSVAEIVDAAKSDIQHSGRILLAEDNTVNQIVAVAMLEELGWVADVAVNGAEAVSMWGQGRYDLILMDCQMPELDGFGATRRIRAEEQAPDHIPILAMTANVMDSDREACLAAGMDDFISKPVAIERLGQALDQWAPGAELGRTA